MSSPKPTFLNSIPTAPSMESLVVRLSDIEARLDERFDLNRESLIQMLKDSERVVDERVKALHALLAERDVRRENRYEEQERSTASKFVSMKEQTALAFAASDKAITKSETAQQSYNTTHNDLSAKMDSQYKAMIPRPEHAAQLAAIDEKVVDLKEAQIALRIEMMKEIQNLRESRSLGEGEHFGKINQQQLITWVIGLGLAAIVVGTVVVDIALRLK